MWGTSIRQRLRLTPLYAALQLARFVPAQGEARRDECANSWKPGIAVVIPERDAPQMLAEALRSLGAALAAVSEPAQVIVVVNGTSIDAYASLHQTHPAVEWVHDPAPLGFSTAIARGLERVRHDWTYLLNNDMTLAEDALAHLAARRAPGVFSLSSQIFQRSADGRREETGFTDWYADSGGIHAYHAPVPPSADAIAHLAGSGGATLFRTAPLRRYVRDSRCYDPFYWEDIEWGVRAWHDGHRVLFCAGSHAWHRHRSTTARFYDAPTLDRIVARNRLLFDARNIATRFGADWLMRRICDLAYASQRELAHPRVATGVLRARSRARRGAALAAPPVLSGPAATSDALAQRSFSYRLRAFGGEKRRPRVLIVTPFAVFPPRHGGARRIAGLLDSMRVDCDVVLLTDEATLHDSRSFAGFDGLAAVHLVQRPPARDAAATALEARMRTHVHPALVDALRAALARHRPDIVQVEFAELAPLVRERVPGARWVLALHDAVSAADFASPEAATRFARECIDPYDAVTVCSIDDARLVAHRDVVCIPNASSVAPGGHAASASSRLLFLGPFRYEPNHAGVRSFLRDAYPAIKAAVPEATLRVLGGDGAPRRVAGDPPFAQDGVEVVEHREDVAGELAECALTINPLCAIRGSPVKLVESLAAGRVCVSTTDGARGFAGEGFAGLVTVADVGAMAAPIVRLLRDHDERDRLERADAARLADYTRAASAAALKALHLRLLDADAG
ncbi:MAG: glycosyltransferase [Betaproteobacteria bacterium]